MIRYQVLYWRDIPAQIKVFVGKRPQSYPLPERFQTGIDRIAMREGIVGCDAYLDQWQWSETCERPGDVTVATLLREIEEEGDRAIASSIKP